MATDDERRRAAANLRELAPGSEWPRAVAVACGMDTARMSGNFHEYTEQLCMRLADLIEPAPSCELWDAGEQECYSVRTVKPVDRDALLALADEMDMDAGCNAYVDDYVVNDYARRIRDALGVER